MSGKRNLLHWSMSGMRNLLHWSMSRKRNLLHWSMSGKRVFSWMYWDSLEIKSKEELQRPSDQTGFKVDVNGQVQVQVLALHCSALTRMLEEEWRRGKNKLAKREFVSLLISDKEKKTVSVLGHLFAARKSKDQLMDNCQTPDLPRYPSISNHTFKIRKGTILAEVCCFVWLGWPLNFSRSLTKILRTFKTFFGLSKNFQSTALRSLHLEYCTPYLRWLQ